MACVNFLQITEEFVEGEHTAPQQKEDKNYGRPTHQQSLRVKNGLSIGIEILVL